MKILRYLFEERRDDMIVVADGQPFVERLGELLIDLGSEAMGLGTHFVCRSRYGGGSGHHVRARDRDHARRIMARRHPGTTFDIEEG